LVYRGEGTEPHLFTGDSLFPGGVGNTRGDKGAFATLLADVRAKLFERLPDETVFHPGHGDDSTLGAVRGSLDAWKRRGWRGAPWTSGSGAAGEVRPRATGRVGA